MKFIEPYYNNPSDYKRDIQQDIIIPVNTVHDEVNFGVETFLLKPVLKKIIHLFTAKEIIDRFGYPYMNFLYDTEFNLKTGAFSGEGYSNVEGFSPYDYVKNGDEHKAREELNKVISKNKPKEEVEKDKEIVVAKEVIEGIDLKKYITKKDGLTLIVEVDGKKFRYKHKVKKKLAKVLKSGED